MCFHENQVKPYGTKVKSGDFSYCQQKDVRSNLIKKNKKDNCYVVCPYRLVTLVFSPHFTVYIAVYHSAMCTECVLIHC